MSRPRRWYLGATLLVAALVAFAPEPWRAYAYLVSAPLTIPAIVGVARSARELARLPWMLLLIAMGILSVANASSVLQAEFGGLAESVVMVGYGVLLAAALCLVLLRGRNDIGGMLDVSVAAIGVGGGLWVALLAPHLRRVGAPADEKLTILISILVLTGVLGALLRLWFSDRRPPALAYLLGALGLALIGNIMQVLSHGPIGHVRVPQLLFTLAYGCVGLAMLEPSLPKLVSPGPAPVDTLSVPRLALLGVALMAYPVAGGIEVMLGFPPDGPLLTAGSLLITPLVMIRLGRLARQRERAEQRLRHQATHDQLTGLPNRAELLARLETAVRLEHSAREPGVVLLFCDLNGFKPVNDRLGHEAGDQLLASFARRLRTGLRAGDTVARYGGDEFLLLCSAPGAQSAAADRLRAHVLAALEAPFRLGSEDVRVSASIGVVISSGGAGADELISEADQRMYREKAAAR